MIPSFINDYENLLILFDMDGVVAEYHTGEEPDIVNNTFGVYQNKRPIMSMIKLAKKLSKRKNVTVGILSSCDYDTQVYEKLIWLKKYMPFIKRENVHIIVWERDGYTLDRRKYGKLEKIQTFTGYDKVYLIEDTHENILTINSVIPNCAHHISMFMD